MNVKADGETRIRGFCALCRSRCGCISTVRDGKLVAVEPDPEHPTGAALCAKGRAAPELVHSPDRLLHPMARTRPKGDPDPGWKRISWDEALDRTAAELRRLADTGGPESVAFAVTTPSGTSMSDSIQWVERLINAFGSPNNVYGTEICNWHKDVATAYTYGVGIGTPDFAEAGCILLWGYNPSTSWLAKARGVAGARAAGAKLVVVDPRRAGAAAKADQWLRVRPGTDGALALGLANLLIANGWYDDAFVRQWTNGPLLVHPHRNRLLTEADIAADGNANRYVAWDDAAGAPVAYDPVARTYVGGSDRFRLAGPVEINGLACRPAFDRYAALCAEFPPARVAEICGVPEDQLAATAELIWRSRPVCYYAWSGVGQHTNATQTDRAISLLYALTGSYDAPGGNVHFAKVPTADLSGRDLMPETQAAKALGLTGRPLGPAKDGWITSADFYRAVLAGEPYPVRGLVCFGPNLLVSHAGAERGAEALAKLAFHVHADLVLTPTAAYADIVLPVASAWEREGLRPGFETDQAANELVQFRAPALPPVGEARSDAWIVFELAKRLGLGDRFWNGDIDAGWRAMLAPSGIGLDELRAQPEGVRVPLETQYRKYRKQGFATPSGKAEIWSETFRRHGYPALPAFVPPAAPDDPDRYPLVLTSAKSTLFCHSQHRHMPSLRRRAPHPAVEIHPDTAAERGIEAGDWVRIETPVGALRARAALKATLAPDVVAAQHGWWQGCEALDLPGYSVTGPDSANLNGAVAHDRADPISGSVPHRSCRCAIRRE